MKDEKLLEKLKPLVRQLVNKELDRDREAEKLKYQMLQAVGAHVDEDKDDSGVIEVYNVVMGIARDRETRSYINQIATPYFVKQLAKRGVK